mmetsp:Transcript_30477/g.42452  ORF Transcript_30477/g.42452 Transcript_30477/m.42452 type:complete len:349 (+) Transcript_30477:18-1064(+)|eukprot:CAMPEP_0185251424 /NCGR_PEP_ID=MMETSP1359-20130426/832_1 /TAXON_ID=552665 /ORGANISM="Bigelowiella longifila, Strain CCMP242" /LENGTH=348 /DNA_ID=CAMNT_0027833325 /DNA_START=1 /DNA_END=1047 /DNA_ORIENTATION=+
MGSVLASSGEDDQSNAPKSGSKRDDDLKLPFHQRMACRLLTVGPTPTHIAFIMDGNRRYARKLGVERIVGHRRGYSTLLRVLKWCNHLNVKVVTVYAFALDNFKRSKREVDSLMELAVQKFTEMLDSEREISQFGVRVNIIGALKRLPPKLQHVMARVMKSTRGHNKLVLNIAFAYSANQEFSDAASMLANGVDQGLLKIEDVSANLVQKCLYTAGQPDPDLLIRTSGETRLSDFMIHQCRRGSTLLSFVEPLWPEFSFWQFWAIIFHYQTQHRSLDAERNRLKKMEGDAQQNYYIEGKEPKSDSKKKKEEPEVDSDEMKGERISNFLRKCQLGQELYVDRLAVNKCF